MHVTYAPRNPQDGERQEWDFDPDDILISEAELVQRHFGGTWDEFSVAVQKGDAKARRVLLWMLMRREHKAIQVRDVPDFRTGELKVEHSVAELLDLQEKIVGADMPPAQQQMMVAAFEVELAEARRREGVIDSTAVEVVEPGKPTPDMPPEPAATG
jgi:hypothetical protein